MRIECEEKVITKEECQNIVDDLTGIRLSMPEFYSILYFIHACNYDNTYCFGFKTEEDFYEEKRKAIETLMKKGNDK